MQDQTQLLHSPGLLLFDTRQMPRNSLAEGLIPCNTLSHRIRLHFGQCVRTWLEQIQRAVKCDGFVVPDRLDGLGMHAEISGRVPGVPQPKACDPDLDPYNVFS